MLQHFFMPYHELAINKSSPYNILLYCLCEQEVHEWSSNKMDFIS